MIMTLIKISILLIYLRLGSSCDLLLHNEANGPQLSTIHLNGYAKVPWSCLLHINSSSSL